MHLSRQAADLLAEVPRLIGVAQIDNTRRRMLFHWIAATEAFVKRPNPRQAMLLDMVKRLLPASKMVRLERARVLSRA